LPIDRVLTPVPPSLPTGTVSRTAAGTRTFPPESDRERASAASTQPGRPSRPQTLPTTPSPGPAPSAVVPRREHDVAVSREHERVAELEDENEALRDYIETQAAERRAVIERYERLLDWRDATEPVESSATAAPPRNDSLAGRVRSALSTVRSRIVHGLALD
jgi:hypothetical protein